MEGLRRCGCLTNESNRHGDDGRKSTLLLAGVVAQGSKVYVELAIYSLK